MSSSNANSASNLIRHLKDNAAFHERIKTWRESVAAVRPRLESAAFELRAQQRQWYEDMAAEDLKDLPTAPEDLLEYMHDVAEVIGISPEQLDDMNASDLLRAVKLQRFKLLRTARVFAKGMRQGEVAQQGEGERPPAATTEEN